ncbi:hypothetical protein Taro_001131 [Colocasia esculenta]|uniref:Uncharacterized protein n=1 Tax=Colocasia esculenta TaxID=4460 RepID=A0A843TFA5_COLES|nr:hypothetical protein [Colocasia esculenta]
MGQVGGIVGFTPRFIFLSSARNSISSDIAYLVTNKLACPGEELTWLTRQMRHSTDKGTLFYPRVGHSARLATDKRVGVSPRRGLSAGFAGKFSFTSACVHGPTCTCGANDTGTSQQVGCLRGRPLPVKDRPTSHILGRALNYPTVQVGGFVGFTPRFIFLSSTRNSISSDIADLVTNRLACPREELTWLTRQMRLITTTIKITVTMTWQDGGNFQSGIDQGNPGVAGGVVQLSLGCPNTI